MISYTKSKLVLYSTIALGTSLLGFTVYRLLRKSRGFTELNGDPFLTPLSDTPHQQIPAIVLYFNDSQGGYTEYELNYTPQSSRNDPNMISEDDYQRLQSLDIIPQGFPLEQIVAVPSHNENNWFFVGYSDPVTIRTNRDPLTVIQPLWAVSYGVNYDPSSEPPKDFPNLEEFYDVALRTTFAEWLLTNRGEDGCHRNQPISACDIERAAILTLIIERTRMKQARLDGDLSYTSVIYGPGIRWNASAQFMGTYEGDIPEIAIERFNHFLSGFWPKPQLCGSASSFIHPFSMSSGGSNPTWIKEAQPLESNYLSEHPILLGRAVFIDNRRTFK